MDQGRWKTVNHIFHAALEVSASERHSFVLTASEGDPDLQAEVELLLQADQDVGSYLESPLLPNELFSSSASPVNAGDVLCGRFRILRAVGEGGMGHVFEALDSELSVHVALKIIRSEIATNPEALARFRQEVRLARRITHPNVCRTFDIERENRVVDPVRGTKQEVVFLTMEFLQGETLASRIKRAGALPLDEALEVARQVADALQAANILNIVHRDMKPANIMLVPTEASAPHGSRAVITDFGLARIDAVVSAGNGSALSHTTRPIGTLAYMAPEQLEGSAASPATDIYAFGLVLFEMVTGKRAFPSNNFLSGIAQRLTGLPPSPQAIIPSLPESWCRAIEGCLHANPADRFQIATDVVVVVEGGRVRLPPVSRTSMAHRSLFRNWHLLRRIGALSAILIAAVALFTAGPRFYKSRVDSKVTAGSLVYFVPVKNETGERTLDNLTELIRAGLTQSTHINLLEQSAVGDKLRQMAKAADSVIDQSTAREIALRAGAVRVVFATVSGSSGNYKLHVDIERPDPSEISRPRENWEESFAWHTSSSANASTTIPPELLVAVRNTSDWIRDKVGESADDIGRLNLPPEDVTTRDWQALMDYDQARQWLQEGRKEDAIGLLRDAVRRDSGFASAYADLADNVASMGNANQAYEYYLKALNGDAGQRLSRKERDFIKGDFATDSRDYQAALDAFRDASAFYDRDFLSWFKQSYPLEKLNRPTDALHALEHADALSTTHDARGEMAFPFILLGDYASAKRSIEEFRAAGHTDHAALIAGVEAVCEGNYAQASELFTRLQQSTDHELLIVAFLDETRLLSEQGRFAEALTVNRRASDAVYGFAPAEVRAELWLDRGYLDLQSQKHSSGLSDISEAITVSREPNTLLLASTIIGNVLSTLTASDRHRAQELLGQMEQFLPKRRPEVIFELARLQIRGEVLLSRGSIRDAIAAFRAADQLDAPISPREYLARALVAAANRETDPAQSSQLRKEALTLYGKTSLKPAAVWLDANALPPGFVSDQMSAYMELAHLLHMTDPDIQRVSATLTHIRGNSPAEFSPLAFKGRATAPGLNQSVAQKEKKHAQE